MISPQPAVQPDTPNTVNWSRWHPRTMQGSIFTLSDHALERLRRFLASPIRQAPTHNINAYWLQRRLNLTFWLADGTVEILNDSNLNCRMTQEDVAFMRRFPRLPRGLMRVLERTLCRAVTRADEFLRDLLRAERLYQRLAIAERSQFPAPFVSIAAAWPERTHFMIHASDVIDRYAPRRPEPLRVLEIGSGPSLLTAVMWCKTKSQHVNIDLPEQIAVGFSMLHEFLPQLRTLLPHEIETLEGQPYDVAFLTPEQLGLLEDRQFDVSVNMCSFQEMSKQAIGEYFSLLRRVLAPDGILYCANRIAKPNPHDRTISAFADYPWLPKDVFLFDREDLSDVPGGTSQQRECVIRLQTTVRRASNRQTANSQ